MELSSSMQPIEENGAIALDELFQHTPVGVLLAGFQCMLLDVNDALCAMLGYERAELVGRKITDISHPDEVADVLERTAALREGRTASYVASRRYMARNGQVVHAKVSVSIMHAKDGTPICVIGFVENMTERVKMEAALRQSEARYRRIVEDQTDLIMRCLPDGTRTFVNEAYCRYRNAAASELLGTSFFAGMDADEQRVVRDKFAALSPSRPAITDQRRVTGPDGARRWQEWTDRGFFDRGGRLLEIQSVGRDLTEQYEARLRFVESEERYRHLFDSLPVAVWENDWTHVAAELARRGLTTPEAMVAAVKEDPSLYDELGTTVRVTTVNPAALAMAGVDTVEQFDAWLARSATHETALRFSEVVPALIFGDRVFALDEYTLIRPDGQRIHVLIRTARSQRWGELCTMSTIAVDVTERKRIEQELQHKQEVTDRAEAAAHLGTWEWRVEDDLVYGSAEFWRILDGREDGGPRMRAMDEILARMHPADAAEVGERWERLLAPSGPRPTVFESHYRLVREDGSIVVVHGQHFATYGPDGALIRAFGVFRDVTEAKRAEEEAARHRDELIRADKMISLGILVSGIGHEINNPNHTIGLNAPLVRAAWQEAAALLDEIAATRPGLRIGRMPWSEARREVAAMVEDIEVASDRIRNIVTELRGFALDHESSDRSPVAVNEIVHSSLRLLGKHIARATRNFAIELAQGVPLVAGNPRRLEQVVVNLVLNACQALENEEQAIRILTGVENQRAFIRVRDEGRGIAADDLPKIRTPFFTTKRAEGGTGLGVPVSDLIAAEHGGELTFESEPGRGTTATLWLPVGAR